MELLSGARALDAQTWIDRCAEIAARDATCHRSRCGSVVVANVGPDTVVLGEGVNTPPGGCTLAACLKPNLAAGFKSDRTCCMHAEQRAIMQALRTGLPLCATTIYFARIDDEGRAKRSGDPYCTICSKMALDAGISRFVLAHPEGIVSYDTAEYNDLSFQYSSMPDQRPTASGDVGTYETSDVLAWKLSRFRGSFNAHPDTPTNTLAGRPVRPPGE